MEFRKNPKSNLEDKKVVFVLVGMLMILSVAYAAFNVKSYAKSAYDYEMSVEDDLAELPPVTTPPPPPPPPPPPAKPPVEPEIKLVEDEVISEEPAEVIEDVPMSFVSNMPFFGDCGQFKNNFQRHQCTMKQIQQFIRDNFEVPDIAREMGYGGKINIQFTVNKQGRVSNISIIKGIVDIVDKEAIRVINKLPIFTPGKNLDKPTSVLYNVPITVTVE